MRPAPQQLVPHRRPGAVDRIVRGVFVLGRPLAPAVEDAQHDRARAGIHRSQCLSRRQMRGLYANTAPGR